MKYDVLVIGGGHAGIEAAYAAAKMGASTLLLTLNLDKIGAMPCNPSVGGLGKGHIVYEISALGGLMPQLCSKSYLQARMLNTRKGPAVQGLRLQIDKYAYSALAKKRLEELSHLTMVSAMTQSIITEKENGKLRICGVVCADGKEYRAQTVIVTTGTFMRGVVHVGLTRYKAGRRGEAASYGLSDSIAEAMGVKLERLKTGTPPRLRGSSIAFSALEKQVNQKLSYLFDFDPIDVEEKIPCYIAHTNQKTCSIIRENLEHSAMYSGAISAGGPRYCPSIEDKVGRFPDRFEHHIFVEPEGADIDEVYPSGISTSLPYLVQKEYIRSIKGFEKAELVKCGYAIEYDFIQPNNLNQTLETKAVKGLYLAGQLNGTTGYEEAAGQGLVAGVNAVLAVRHQKPFVISRSEGYIGVMLDDLTTLGVTEPYRMFTSRAERRLLLRQDNVFARLMPAGHRLGLVSDDLFNRFKKEQACIEWAVGHVKKMHSDSAIRKMLLAIVWEGAVVDQVRGYFEEELRSRGDDLSALSERALLSIHAEIKYEGYLARERQEVKKTKQFEELTIPVELDLQQVPGLNDEMKEKLNKHSPETIAQAQLIPGMTPAAISILIFQIRRFNQASKVLR